MKSFAAHAYDGWCQPVAIPILSKPKEYSMRPGMQWSTSGGTWKRMPYQTFPLITTYVRGALHYFDQDKLVSSSGSVPFPQGAALKVRAAGGAQTSPKVKEVADTCTKPRVQTKVVDCEDTKKIQKMEVRTVHRTIEVASKTEKRFVPREVPVDTAFIVPRFEDREVPVVMANTISSEIEETAAVVEVPVARYVPHLVPIDVYVPRAVAIPVVMTDEVKEESLAPVPKKTLQQLIKEMNPHLEEIEKFNASQNTKFQELVEKSQKAANFAKYPVPEPQSTPILKITEIEVEGEESDHLVKQICFTTGGYQATEVESLFNALTTTATADSEADMALTHKELSGEQTDPDTHDDMLSAATGASESQRCTSNISGKDAAEGVAAEGAAAEEVGAEGMAAEEVDAGRIAAEEMGAERIAAEELGAEGMAAEEIGAEGMAAEEMTDEGMTAAEMADEGTAAGEMADEGVAVEDLAANASEKAASTIEEPKDDASREGSEVYDVDTN